MDLILTVLRCPNTVAPETRTIQGGEYIVGRGLEADWVLTDTNSVISKRHFIVAFRAGGWQLADVSTNGTYLNHETQSIGQGSVRDLRDGDRVRVGEYEIEIGLNQAGAEQFGAPGGGQGNAFDDPFGADPFATPKARNAFDEPDRPAISGAIGASLLPDDFDPLGPLDAPPPQQTSHARTQSDHSSVLEDAFRPPSETGQMDFHAGGIIPGAAKISDDWADDLLEGIGGPPAPAKPMAFTPSPLAEIAAPAASSFPFEVAAPLEIAAPTPAAALSGEARELSPFLEPGDSIDPFPAIPVQPSIAAPPPRATPRAAPPAPVLAPTPVHAPAYAPGSNGSNDGALIAAFMTGVGLPDSMPKDPPGTMRALGAAFRAMVTGIRSILIARATIKSEFRIEQTMIRASGNNPLKFSADDDDALAALLGVGRRTDMTPGAAVADALRDIRLHELASMAAMQAAARALLTGLDPVAIRATADQAGGMAVLPAQKKARAWDAFEALHGKTLQALNDDFDSVFGKAFARAYEEAMHEISARDRK